MPQRGKTFVNDCERAECRPESRASRPVEFAETGQEQRQHGPQPVADPHGAVRVADADVDVQGEGVGAPGHPLQALDDRR
jgi:hypothetical protein